MKYLIADINNHQGPWMPVVTPGKPGHLWHQTVRHLAFHHWTIIGFVCNVTMCIYIYVHCVLCVKGVRSKTVKNVHGGEIFCAVWREMCSVQYEVCIAHVHCAVQSVQSVQCRC